MARIHVTQGHEDSIGLEVFLKSFLLLNNEQKSLFTLYCYKKTLQKNLEWLKVNIDDLNTVFIEDKKGLSQSFQSLVEAEAFINTGDVLLTLPTSKSELKDSKFQYSGHTDYFRKKYGLKNIVMLFLSDRKRLALLTEHCSLEQVKEEISEELIQEKIKNLLESPYKFNRFIFSGINPHCGEEGLIGTSDEVIFSSISRLKSKYKNLSFIGPLSGDAVFTNTLDYGKRDCLIAASHDQGLAPFKALSGLRASNITLGLPFLRLSPDHGTAFDLYGKDKANYFGMFFTMKEAIKRV